MKKYLVIVALALLSASSVKSQGIALQSQTMTATGTIGPLATTGMGAVNLKWTGSGTQTTCTVAVDTSSDGSSWSAGAAIPNTTCTATSGSVTVYGLTPSNFMRINLSVLSGAGNTVVLTLQGYGNSQGAAPANVLVLSTGAITPGATSAAIQTTGQTATLTGVTATDQITLLTGPAPTSLCPLVQTRSTAANQITMYYTTLTAAGCTPAAGTYIYLIVR